MRIIGSVYADVLILMARVAELFSDRYDDEELAQLARLLEPLPA